jgi:hypothetical protein
LISVETLYGIVCMRCISPLLLAVVATLRLANDMTAPVGDRSVCEYKTGVSILRKN